MNSGDCSSSKVNPTNTVLTNIMQLRNLPITLSTITRLPAPPRVPSDIASMLADDAAGFSPLAGTCVETAARSERKRDAKARFETIAALIKNTLKGI